LYSKGAILGFRRSNHNQQQGTSLLQIEGFNDKNAAKVSNPQGVQRSPFQFYLGKRVAYIYKAQKKRNDSKVTEIYQQ